MKLYRFDYSPYARKVQVLLELLEHKIEVVDVPYLSRHELVEVTGGYNQVPVLVMNDGEVLKDSRVICKSLLSGDKEKSMVPAPFQGPIWGYADWCDMVLEDVLFRLASPDLARRFKSAEERALFTYIKERKYGEGCIRSWEASRADLLSRAKSMLRPTMHTLSSKPFVFGDAPTYADAALFGQAAMLEVADVNLITDVAPELTLWMQRMNDWVRLSRKS